MTTQHQGAIALAKTGISDEEHTDAITLATAIVTRQSAEITEAADILSRVK